MKCDKQIIIRRFQQICQHRAFLWQLRVSPCRCYSNVS